MSFVRNRLIAAVWLAVVTLGTLIAVSAPNESAGGISIDLKPLPELSRLTNDVRRDAVVEAVERAMPTVVNIATENIRPMRDPMQEMLDEFWNPFYQRRTPDEPYSLGSGVIISEDGFVLTNDHVVQRANKIWVKLADSGKVYEARLIAISSKDIALLKIVTTPGEKFTAIKFAPEDDLLLGETVLALGNPFNLGGSVSRGILSSKNRIDAKGDEPLNLYNCLQTDASINPGNSGGPLVNLHGELIGVNAVILRGAQGIGFAIPVKQVNNALSQLVTPETVGQLWFGARVRSDGGPLLVSGLEPGSPAAIAGVKTGDVITQVDGNVPGNYLEFNRMIVSGGQKEILLTLARADGSHIVRVRLIPETSFFNAELIQKRLGMSLQSATPQLAQSFGRGTTNCFVVTSVEPDSPAAAVNLQPGFLITLIDGQIPASLTRIAKILHAKNKGDITRLEFVAQQQRDNFVQRYQGSIEVPVR